MIGSSLDVESSSPPRCFTFHLRNRAVRCHINRTRCPIACQLTGLPDESGRNVNKSPSMAVRQPEQMSAEPTECDTITELFAALESPLLAYALRLTGDLSVAEDVFQEAFMRLHTQFDEVREPKRWLYRTVHNLAMNHLRDANKIVPLDLNREAERAIGTDNADPQPLPDEQIDRKSVV